MIQYSFLDSVMDAKDHLKNGTILKKLISRRKQFIHFIFVFTFLFYSFSLQAQFDNEKYDKESFLIGTLNEYMNYQRTFTNGSKFYYQRVDIMSQGDLKHALFIDSLFNLDYSDITIVNNGAPQGIKIYSPSLSLKIDDFYDYRPERHWTLQGDTIHSGHLKKEMFETEKQKLSFLLGVYLRYGFGKDRTNTVIQSLKRDNLLEGNKEYENVFSMSNAPSKAKVCVELLKELDCNAEYVMRQTTIPVGHFVIFIPSNKIREVIIEAVRLTKYIETIDTNHVNFILDGKKFIWDEPEKP